ncbi:nitroreductase family protein [Streptomyces sp. NBC_01244]|uniref:nitroreductase family protein n=1 Tax=Streptomyces sp. NBC_01244 TaxID=2903797 RepID=UPI002E13EAF0|nr:nitroreductase family protein [Streptomyces sp. NBC_01244]
MTYLLNEFMRIRLEDPLQCDLLLEGKTYGLPDVRCLPVLASVSEPTSREELVARFRKALGADERSIEHLVTRMIDTRIFRPSDSEHELMPQVGVWQKYGWTDALVYHLMADRQIYSDVVGSPAPADSEEVLRARIAERRPPAFWKTLDVPYQPLPAPAEPADRDLADVLLSRRSHRPWTKQRMTAAQLSRVLTDVNVPLVTQRRAAEANFEKTPSALMHNSFGDVETSVIVYDVEGLEPGIYHYDPDGHGLGLIRSGDLRDEVQTAFVGQSRASSGSCSLLLSVVWERHLYRYVNNPHGYRSMMECLGQFAQRYLLAWTSLGFETFPTPAHYAALTDSLIGTKRFEETGIYLLTAG